MMTSPTATPQTSSCSTSSMSGNVQLTEQAANQVLSMTQGTEKGLRLGLERGGCSGWSYVFAIEPAREGDSTFCAPNGAKLIVDGNILPKINGARIDYVSGLSKAGFVVTNPQAKTTCGCGSSFDA